MREILFRGICEKSGEMVFGNLIYGVDHKKGSLYILPNKTNLAYIKHCDPLDGVKVIPESVGQFTGLTDKNGTKIFEGDILSCKVWIDGQWEDSIEPVIFKDGCFGLDWSYHKDESYWEVLSKEIEGKVVLGNIHEKSKKK